jgi:hypothetical protein
MAHIENPVIMNEMAIVRNFSLTIAILGGRGPYSATGGHTWRQVAILRISKNV